MPNNITHKELLETCSYDKDTGIFILLKNLRTDLVGKRMGRIIPNGYRVIKLKQKHYRAGRLAVFYMTGRWPRYEVDHANGFPGDDRFCNLREATSAQNKHNIRRHSDGESGYKGVSKTSSGKWQAKIYYKGRNIQLGSFILAEEAAKVYDRAARKFFGSFARGNFI